MVVSRNWNDSVSDTLQVWYLFVFFSKTVAAECGEAGGHQLCQLQDRDHHALAKESGRRASLQRVRPLLQAAQRK